jgi:hypothetical protein
MGKPTLPRKTEMPPLLFFSYSFLCLLTLLIFSPKIGPRLMIQVN